MEEVEGDIEAETVDGNEIPDVFFDSFGLSDEEDEDDECSPIEWADAMPSEGMDVSAKEIVDRPTISK